MTNRPRLSCPRCGKAMRRIYTQHMGPSGSKYETVEGRGYCKDDDEVYGVANA